MEGALVTHVGEQADVLLEDGVVWPANILGRLVEDVSHDHEHEKVGHEANNVDDDHLLQRLVPLVQVRVKVREDHPCGDPAARPDQETEDLEQDGEDV